MPLLISFQLYQNMDDGEKPTIVTYCVIISGNVLAFHRLLFFCLFDLILYVPSTIFQLNWDGSSWVEPVLS